MPGFGSPCNTVRAKYEPCAMLLEITRRSHARKLKLIGSYNIDQGGSRPSCMNTPNLCSSENEDSFSKRNTTTNLVIIIRVMMRLLRAAKATPLAARAVNQLVEVVQRAALQIRPAQEGKHKQADFELNGDSQK